EAESDEQREEAAQKYLRQTDMVAAAGDVIEDERGESSEGPDRGAGSDEDGRECQGQGAQPSTRDPLGGISHSFRSPSSAFAEPSHIIDCSSARVFGSGGVEFGREFGRGLPVGFADRPAR